MTDVLFQAVAAQSNSEVNVMMEDPNHLEAGSPENHRPYIPKYSMKDENLLRRVDLTSLESVNATFFPEEFAKGKIHWVVVPKHVLGIDTDFSFVAQKVEEYRQLERVERQRELSRWDKMARWERNMYEDRIAILMQQRLLLVSGSGHGGCVGNLNNSPTSVVKNTTSSSTNGVLTCSRDFSVAPNSSSNNKRRRSSPNAAAAFAIKPAAASPSAVASSDAIVAAAAHSIASYSEVPESKRRCIRLKPPIPSRYQGDIEGQKDAIVPEFISLMNFPALSLPDGLRCCVMCGTACPTSATLKSKKLAAGGATGGRGSKSNTELAFIPTQNKGLCTLCDVNVWVIASNQMEIKWCKGCKNFRCWAAFGEKGHATKCLRCRERQREKYAAQKEEKEKGISSSTTGGRTPKGKGSK